MRYLFMTFPKLPLKNRILQETGLPFSGSPALFLLAVTFNCRDYHGGKTGRADQIKICLHDFIPF